MRKLLTLCMALMLVLSLAVPGSAVTGFVYDETQQLDTPELWHQNALLEEAAIASGIRTEFFVLTYTGEGQTLMDLAQSVYEKKDPIPENYICLMLQANADDTGWHLNPEDPWCLLIRGNIADNTALVTALELSMNALITQDNWSGPLEEDQKVLALTTGALVTCLQEFTQEAAPAPVAATPYILDDAQLLTPQALQELNAMAETIADTYGIGVYAMTVEDFTDYGSESQIFDVLWNFYHHMGLGCGPDREGMILMLSMAERDYATFFYGEETEYAFNDFGQVQLEERFLDNFGNDDWYGGFLDYFSAAEEFLAKAEAGEPVRDNPWDLAMLFVLIALFVSFVITRILWMRMSNVAAQKGARAYQTPEGLVLTHKEDRFINQTVMRRRIQKSSSGSGSSSHSGGGGSGRSGKF